MHEPPATPDQEVEPALQKDRPGFPSRLHVKNILGLQLNRRAAAGFAVGAVSFTASAVAIADFIRSDDSPAERNVKITEVSLITWETLGEFLDRLANREHESLETLAPNLESFSPQQLELKGVIVQFHVELVGLQNEIVELQWSLYDAYTRRLLEDPAFRAQAGFPEKYLEAYSQNDQRTGEIWIPAPLLPGTYYANMEIWDGNNNRAHSYLSPEFSVRRDGSIGL